MIRSRHACARGAGSALLLATLLAGCGSLLESQMAPPQAYVLRLPPAEATGDGSLGSVRVQRPEAGPGLNSDRIALLRGEGRFDYYAAARWAAPAPMLVESVLVDALRSTGNHSAVFDDSAPFAPRYDLRVTIRRFEADYSAGGDPTVHVVLDCTLGSSRDRRLLASFTAGGAVRAADNRLGAVVAAFESAMGQATARILEQVRATVAADAGPRLASEGR